MSRNFTLDAAFTCGLDNATSDVAIIMTGGLLPESVSDFRLVSKPCYEAIRTLRESHRFIRVLGSWVGFKTTNIEIDRPPRFAGESKWLGTSLLRVIVQGFQIIFAYSTLPLDWVSIFRVFASIASVFSLIVLTAIWIVLGVPFAGPGSIIATILLCFSVTILVLGIIAQYIGLIYGEVKQRPLYLIEELVN